MEAPNYYTFKNGFSWGMLFASVNLYWLWHVVYLHSNNALGWLVPPLAIGYIAAIFSIWFVTLRWAKIPLAFAAISTGFFYILDNLTLHPFGCVGGYPLANPLLLLCGNPLVRGTISLLGIYSTLFMLFFLLRTLPAKISVASLLLLIFTQKDYKVAPPSSWVLIDASKIKHSDPLEALLLIKTELAKHPTARNFFACESAFPFPLNRFEQYLHWLDIPGNVNLFIGASKICGKDDFNSAYQVCNSSVVDCYNKKNLFPLTEYVAGNAWLEPVFRCGYVCRGSPCCSFELDGKRYNVLICSDMLGRHLFKEDNLIFINDGWFPQLQRWLIERYLELISLDRQCRIVAIFPDRRCVFSAN